MSENLKSVGYNTLEIIEEQNNYKGPPIETKSSFERFSYDHPKSTQQLQPVALRRMEATARTTSDSDTSRGGAAKEIVAPQSARGVVLPPAKSSRQRPQKHLAAAPWLERREGKTCRMTVNPVEQKDTE